MPLTVTKTQDVLSIQSRQIITTPANTTIAQNETLDKKELAQKLFDQGKFDDAMVVYEQLTVEDEEAALDLRRVWHEAMELRRKANQYTTIEPFLTAFLIRYPYDQLLLAFKAETQVSLGLVGAAIEIYYSLISYTFEVKEEEYYQARIRHLAREQVDLLAKDQSWQAIIDFIEGLLIQEPTFPPYLLAKAEALINLEQMDEAQTILNPLLGVSYYRERAQSLLDRIDKNQLQQTAIKLQPMGEHYLVNGTIDGSSDVKLMIDTGASLSVLTQTMFDEIQDWSAPTYLGDTNLNTAGGRINAPIYEFERFQIDAFYIDKMRFVVVPIENMTNYHGLLGMNFLKNFKFEIDQESNLLILSP